MNEKIKSGTHLIELLSTISSEKELNLLLALTDRQHAITKTNLFLVLLCLNGQIRTQLCQNASRVEYSRKHSRLSVKQT